MKKYLFLIIFSLACVILYSCENTKSPSPGDELAPEKLTIIKLPSEMNASVFVSPIVDSVVLDYSTDTYTLYYGDSLVLCNPTESNAILADFAKEHLGIVGTNPYIQINEEYAIIDWKWAHFHPLSGAYRIALYSNYHTLPGYGIGTRPVENEEYYLLPVFWEDLSDLTSKWRMQDGERIKKPEILYIWLSEIEKYGDYQSTHIDMIKKYHITPNDFRSTYNLYSRDPAACDDFIDEYNRLQSSYVKTLNEMIKNGDLEKWVQ